MECVQPSADLHEDIDMGFRITVGGDRELFVALAATEAELRQYCAKGVGIHKQRFAQGRAHDSHGMDSGACTSRDEDQCRRRCQSTRFSTRSLIRDFKHTCTIKAYQGRSYFEAYEEMFTDGLLTLETLPQVISFADETKEKRPQLARRVGILLDTSLSITTKR